MCLRCHLHGSVKNTPTVPAPRFNVVVEAYFFSADLMPVRTENLVVCLLDRIYIQDPPPLTIQDPPRFLQHYSLIVLSMIFTVYNNLASSSPVLF